MEMILLICWHVYVPILSQLVVLIPQAKGIWPLYRGCLQFLIIGTSLVHVLDPPLGIARV